MFVDIICIYNENVIKYVYIMKIFSFFPGTDIFPKFDSLHSENKWPSGKYIIMLYFSKQLCLFHNNNNTSTVINSFTNCLLCPCIHVCFQTGEYFGNDLVVSDFNNDG